MTGVPQSERFEVHLNPADVVAIHARHRHRFADAVANLDDDALATKSRCELWSVADVLRHLCDVDGWMHALWNGEPPPFTSFDPILTPHEFVLAQRDVPDREIRDRFVESSHAMAEDVGGSGTERWDAFGISPLGLVPWWLSALHVHWDSWLHERDVLIPLGIEPSAETDEAAPMLSYGLAVVATMISEPTDEVIAGVHVRAGEPPVVVVPGDVPGDVGHIVDALCGRGCLTDALPDIDPDVVHRFDALSRIFAPAS
jgi:uncharacterized protein (TIGR03083 family)